MQVIEKFDIPNDVLNHSATWYLGHVNALASVWRDVAGAGPIAGLRNRVARGGRAARRPNRRALLIGINNYPDPQQCPRRMRERRVPDEFGVAGERLRPGGNPRRARRPRNDRRRSWTAWIGCLMAFRTRRARAVLFGPWRADPGIRRQGRAGPCRRMPCARTTSIGRRRGLFADKHSVRCTQQLPYGAISSRCSIVATPGA